jgi:hypothetical protein
LMRFKGSPRAFKRIFFVDIHLGIACTVLLKLLICFYSI